MPNRTQSARREVVIRRVRCPVCGSELRARFRGRYVQADGSIRRYTRCRDCGLRYDVLETDPIQFAGGKTSPPTRR